MIVLDTNVISEFTKPFTSERVAAWLDTQNASDLCTTTITEAELFAGVVTLPDGKRKSELERATEAMLALFGPRIFPFDREAARIFPLVIAERRTAGLKSDTADSQIAAIARLRGAAVATRNIDHFEHTGVKLINPWTA